MVTLVRKTIVEWCKQFKVVIVDPDGFDRKDPDLYKRLFTEEEFMQGMMRSSCAPPGAGFNLPPESGESV